MKLSVVGEGGHLDRAGLTPPCYLELGEVKLISEP
jgi:hypothetical protein